MKNLIPILTRKNNEAGNPGDVFIRYGLQWLISQVVDSPEYLLLDKFSPKDVHAHLDKIKELGYLLYAGTPQFNNYDDWCLWYDWLLYEDYVIKYGIDFHSFAAGSGFPRVDMTPEEFSQYLRGSQKTMSILRARMDATQTITARDPHVYKLLQDLRKPADLLPCTAAWTAKHLGLQVSMSNKVGFVPPNPYMVNPAILGLQTHEQVGQWFRQLYGKLRTQLRAEGLRTVVICHGKEELKWFAGKYTLYMETPEELMRCYEDLHGVISTRLHGAIPVAAMPDKRAVLIGIDTRQSAAGVFQVPLVKLSPDIVAATIQEYMKPPLDRTQLMEQAEARYKQLISKAVK